MTTVICSDVGVADEAFQKPAHEQNKNPNADRLKRSSQGERQSQRF